MYIQENPDHRKLAKKKKIGMKNEELKRKWISKNFENFFYIGVIYRIERPRL